jgi:phytoene desaturase
MKALIVGAGPGGLSAAVNLAGLGVETTVVEKEAVPGGRMRGLTLGERGEYQVDTGPSIMQLPQVLERIFRRAGLRIEDYVTLKRLPENTRVHFWDGTHLDTHWDQAKMKAEVARLNPSLVPAYERWFTESREKYRIAYGTFMAHPADSLGYYNPLRLLPAAKFKPWQTLYRHLDENFHDDRFSYAFSYPSKYLGLHPTTCSSVFSVIPFLELEFGVWHVMGGFRALAAGMKKAAEDLGATFRMSSPVAKVLVENKKAVGVELLSGEKLYADVVVVNADLPYAARTLIDESWREGTRLSNEALQKAKYSCSTFMLYLALDKKYAELPHHLIYLSNAARRTDKDALEDRHADLDDPPFYVVNPNVTDPVGAPAGHSALYVLVPTPNTAGDHDWPRIEAELTKKVPGWLAKVGMKDVEQHIVAKRAFTAETWRDDFNVHRGAVFNLSHTWLQLGPLRPKVQSPHVENLYWVGGGTHPGSGLLTIMESANIAANYVSERLGRGPLAHWPWVPPPGSLPTSDDLPAGAVRRRRAG